MNSTSAGSDLHLMIVDDHAILRDGLRRILEASGDAMRIEEASSGFQALELLRRAAFDLVIVDLSMPGMSGLDLIRRIRSEYPRTAVLVLSMHAEEEYAMRSFKAGANGYITKDSPAETLVAAVRKVVAGGMFMTPGMAERLVQNLSGMAELPRHVHLSNRELEVLKAIVAGQRVTEIADRLHLSVKTISTHKSHIQEKLQLSNTAALVRYGMEHGLQLDDSDSALMHDCAPEIDTAPGSPARGVRPASSKP